MGSKFAKTFCVLVAIGLFVSPQLSFSQTDDVVGAPKEVTLYAGRTIDVGTVAVSNDSENLYVRFTTTDGWVLDKTHLAVGTSLDDIPRTKKGVPIVGSFPHKTTHTSINEYVYVINLKQAGYAVNTELYIAAHADLSLLDNFGNVVQKEGGWGNGAIFSNKNWATYFGYSIQPRSLNEKDVSIKLELLADQGIAWEQITVMSMFSKDSLSNEHQIANLEFADVGRGQIIFVRNMAGNAYVVAFVGNEDIQKGTFILTIESIADGLIMANPLAMGFSAIDRIKILERARSNEYYEKLKNEIREILQVEPYSLLSGASSPRVYEYALLAVRKTIQSSELITIQEATDLGLRAFNEKAIVGEESRPHITFSDGASINIVNPTMIFYGVDIDYKSPQVISGKPSVWDLEFGIWPPDVSAKFVDRVVEQVDLENGAYNIQFSKFGIGNNAKIMGGAANFLKAGCIVLDTFYFCPASNNTIEKFVELEPIELLASAADDIFSSDTVEVALGKTIDFMLKEEVWAPLTQALYEDAVHKDAVVEFLQDSKMLLSGAKAVLKVLEAYDAANETIPFFWDALLMPNEVDFCVTQMNGLVTETCRYIPPEAVATKVSPESMHVNEAIVFDASGSYDDVDSIDMLQVRWDFNADGIFDTQWSYNKQDSWVYLRAGSYDVILEVMDTDSLIDRTLLTIMVRSNDVDHTMVLVQGGSFIMGCTFTPAPGEYGCAWEEKPAHQVSLTNDYYIGKYEVTQAQWEAVMGSNPSYFSGDGNRPVDNVSWADVQEFIRRLNVQTGMNYRLPTEAEWEFAARGGNQSQNYVYSGSNDANMSGWHSFNSSEATHPVGQKQANELGLYDMSGNVWEWVEDWFDVYGNDYQINPTGPPAAVRDTDRVRRGGSWYGDPGSTRVSYRTGYSVNSKSFYLGFRLAHSR